MCISKSKEMSDGWESVSQIFPCMLWNQWDLHKIPVSPITQVLKCILSIWERNKIPVGHSDSQPEKTFPSASFTAKQGSGEIHPSPFQLVHMHLKTRFSTQLEKPPESFSLLITTVQFSSRWGPMVVHRLTALYFANEHGENMDLFQSIQHPQSHARMREQSFWSMSTSPVFLGRLIQFSKSATFRSVSQHSTISCFHFLCNLQYQLIYCARVYLLKNQFYLSPRNSFTDWYSNHHPLK